MDVYFDITNNRLVQTGVPATSEFWDGHWRKGGIENILRNAKDNRFVVLLTKRYLKNGCILEGGCGAGGKVYALKLGGYRVIGIDFARDTVQELNNMMPELDIRWGDVRDLSFSDGYFDGYWSFGVIEHFYDGYESIVREMHRVLKKGGFAFVAFPYISPLRRLKIRLGLYPHWQEEEEGVDNFYQFVLDHKKVIADFKQNGFLVLRTEFLDGIKCIKDEIGLFKPLLQHIYDSKSPCLKILKCLFNKICSCFAGHMALLIVKKV